MMATVVQPERRTDEKVQNETAVKHDRVDVFRWQKWVDGEGKLWIVCLTFGHYPSGRFGANVMLLDVDKESTIDVPRAEFEEWVRKGSLKRVETPILL